MCLGEAKPLHAAPSCPDSPRPLIVLTARVKPPDEVVAEALRDHLRTQLKARDIDLCVGSAGARKPIATVLLVIERPENGPVRATVRVGDEVTDKRVERTMDLTGMPVDARALAVSSSADELLRASWAELMIADAPEPKMKPPKAVMTAVTSSLQVPEPAPEERSLQLGLLGSVAAHRDMLGFGPELFGAYYFNRHLGVVTRLRLGFTPAKDAEHGSVSALSQGVWLGLAWALSPVSDSAGIGLDAGAGVQRVGFDATAGDGAVSSSTADWSAEVSAGPRGWLDAGPLRLTLGAELVAALRPTTARDADEVVLSNEGLGGRLTLGVLLGL